jgi:hypothetical protein
LLVWLAISHPSGGCLEAALIYKRGKRWRMIEYAGRKRQKSLSDALPGAVAGVAVGSLGSTA